MSIGSVSASMADRGLSAPAAATRGDAEAEPVVALARASTATSRTPGAALTNDSEGQRFDALMAAARAAALRLVTEPVATAPTEKTQTIAERPDAGGPDVTRTGG